jgi:hypothetical protein
MSELGKHRAIIHVSIEVHPLVEKTGECDGHMVPNTKLKEYNIKLHELFSIDGDNLHFCLLKVREKLDQLKAK